MLTLSSWGGSLWQHGKHPQSLDLCVTKHFPHNLVGFSSSFHLNLSICAGLCSVFCLFKNMNSTIFHFPISVKFCKKNWFSYFSYPFPIPNIFHYSIFVIEKNDLNSYPFPIPIDWSCCSHPCWVVRLESELELEWELKRIYPLVFTIWDNHALNQIYPLIQIIWYYNALNQIYPLTQIILDNHALNLASYRFWFNHVSGYAMLTFASILILWKYNSFTMVNDHDELRGQFWLILSNKHQVTKDWNSTLLCFSGVSGASFFASRSSNLKSCKNSYTFLNITF